jgi:hypothetical protein
VDDKWCSGVVFPPFPEAEEGQFAFRPGGQVLVMRKKDEGWRPSFGLVRRVLEYPSVSGFLGESRKLSLPWKEVLRVDDKGGLIDTFKEVGFCFPQGLVLVSFAFVGYSGRLVEKP